MKKIILSTISVFAILASSGCATRLGQFTAASSQNIRNLDYSIADKSKQHVSGKSCIHSIFIIPIGHSDDRIQRAMDNAIKDGHNKGLDGDLLVNVRIDHSDWSVLLYGQDCISVEGDLVKIEKK